jgi:hypothetical protein
MKTHAPYSYKLRPGYGSHELLLDFAARHSPDQLQHALSHILQEAGFVLVGMADLWMNDEFAFIYKSKKGRITFSRDIWDLFFIIGDNNQEDILMLDKLLAENPLFAKEEVDFSNYQ